MKAVVRFSASAVSDLEEIIHCYEGQGVPDVGRKLVGEIVDRVEALRDHPELGRIVPEFGQPFLWELSHPPFRVVYRRDAGEIGVVRVWRSGRLLRVPDA